MGLNEILGIRRLTSKTHHLDVSELENDFTRADLHFSGVDHANYSYRLHVLFNNEKAQLGSELGSVAGYAGTVMIFGHGGCYGGPGHCTVRERNRPADFRRSHPLQKAFKRLNVTEPLRLALKENKTFVLSIVPEIVGGTARCCKPPEHLFEKVNLVTYD